MWANFPLFSDVHRNVIQKDGFYIIWNHQNPENSNHFGKASKLPGIPAENFRNCRFPGIPELPVALY